MKTDVTQFITDLDGGVFEEKIATILSEVAAAVVDNDREGSVNIKLNLKRIGNSYQVEVKHNVKYSKPTSKGTITEDNTTSTPMHVGKGGKMTLFPETQVPHGQTHMFKSDGQPMESNE